MANSPISAKNVINGTYGTLWWNGVKWAECSTFEAKITMTNAAVTLPNDGATYQKTTGWSGTVTLTIIKVYSRIQTEMAAGIQSGNYPRFELVGKLDDPDALGTQRVAIHDLTVDDFVLLKFDQKKVEDDQITGKFSGYNLLDTIPDPS